MITITNLTSETFYPTLQKNLKESIGRMRSDSNVFPKCFKITKWGSIISRDNVWNLCSSMWLYSKLF